MKITVSIKKGSAIDTLWRSHGRRGGEVHGVQFELQGKLFVGVSEIPPGALERLRLNPSVLVEMLGTVELPPAAAIAAPPRRGRPPGSGRKP